MAYAPINKNENARLFYYYNFVSNDFYYIIADQPNFRTSKRQMITYQDLENYYNAKNTSSTSNISSLFSNEFTNFYFSTNGVDKLNQLPQFNTAYIIFPLPIATILSNDTNQILMQKHCIPVLLYYYQKMLGIENFNVNNNVTNIQHVLTAGIRGHKDRQLQFIRFTYSNENYFHCVECPERVNLPRENFELLFVTTQYNIEESNWNFQNWPKKLIEITNNDLREHKLLMLDYPDQYWKKGEKKENENLIKIRSYSCNEANKCTNQNTFNLISDYILIYPRDNDIKLVLVNSEFLAKPLASAFQIFNFNSLRILTDDNLWSKFYGNTASPYVAPLAKELGKNGVVVRGISSKEMPSPEITKKYMVNFIRYQNNVKYTFPNSLHGYISMPADVNIYHNKKEIYPFFTFALVDNKNNIIPNLSESSLSDIVITFFYKENRQIYHDNIRNGRFTINVSKNIAQICIMDKFSNDNNHAQKIIEILVKAKILT